MMECGVHRSEWRRRRVENFQLQPRPLMRSSSIGMNSEAQGFQSLTPPPTYCQQDSGFYNYCVPQLNRAQLLRGRNMVIFYKLFQQFHQRFKRGGRLRLSMDCIITAWSRQTQGRGNIVKNVNDHKTSVSVKHYPPNHLRQKHP